MSVPTIAVLSFPGNNCEVESLRVIANAGMRPLFFKWNDDVTMLKEVDGYFIPGGFSYEDRGRAGMVPARDPLMTVLREEAQRGKPVIGICNGAQVLVESGLIPLGDRCRMSLAKNAVRRGGEVHAPGFLNEWVWIKRSCARDRCATSAWDGVMHIPIAHGEGRFTTRDAGLLNELRKNDQIAFQYCDASGNVSETEEVTPNGSMASIAGLTNREGNVIALMPHPERTDAGIPFFTSMRSWITAHPPHERREPKEEAESPLNLGKRAPRDGEILIDTVIVNNEERTVEQALKMRVPSVRLKQYKYLLPGAHREASDLLGHFGFFNPNKEIAFVRSGGRYLRWESGPKRLGEPMEILSGASVFLRRDEPDTVGASLGRGGESGILYVVHAENEGELLRSSVLEILANPHASQLAYVS